MGMTDTLSAYEKGMNADEAKAALGAAWEPLPMPAAPPEFPVNCLPDPARAMAEAAAEALQVPVDMPACFLLGAASTALLGLCSVRVRSDYIEPCQLYAVVSAPPSDRKSAALSQMIQPVRDYLNLQNDLRAPEVARSQQRLKMLNAKLDKATKAGHEDDMEALVEEIQREPVVKFLELPITDATPEALARAMGRNEGRAALVSGEGALFNVLAGAYSEEVNLDVVLNGYTGEPVHVERVSREPVKIERAALSITLAVQPSVLDKLLSNEVLLSRGLCARFLYSQPLSKVGKRSFRNVKPVPGATQAAYSQRIQQLTAFQANGKPFELALTPEAYEAYCCWFDEVEARIAPGGDLCGLANGWEGKLCGNTLRIVGLLRMLADPDTQAPVSALHLRRAVEIARYFSEHLKAIAGQGEHLTPEAREALAFIIKDKRPVFSPSTLRQKMKDRAKFKGKSGAVDRALLELQSGGYLRLSRPPAWSGVGRRPEARYECHPELWAKRTETEIIL